jgi:type IV pilus assembly protein PilA
MDDSTHLDSSGFTLIELLVVVLIIAILIAIAIPTFLGARQRAQNRAAQSSLRNALTAAKTMYTDKETYVPADSSATGLSTVEPSLTYVATGTASTDAKTISVNPAAADTWYGAAKSSSGNCYYIKETVTGGTQYASGGSSATCTGTAAATQTYSNSW